MSIQLKSLRNIGCILIEKGTPVRLTEIGQGVSERADVILGEVENIEDSRAHRRTSEKSAQHVPTIAPIFAEIITA